LGDARLPAYVNDIDLDPEMSELPQAREGATDMIFCSLRYEFSGSFLHISRGSSTKFYPYPQPLATKDTLLTEKDQKINELENRIGEKYLRFCDPLVPLHNLTLIAARSAMSGMRLRAHHPRQYADGGANLPQSEKDVLFSLSLKILQYDSLVHATKSLQRFLWHVRIYFQWHALIYLLSELRLRKIGDEADAAWDQVEEVFHHHPEMIRDSDHTLYIAIRSL